ncbi:Nitroreductase family protein [Saccharopolyspora shandongensis]|uniref:Nitroreductase family protein n=1 Tax=Saccharopolyspora shandongensis TaxID=418495 RepID=A0A1H3PGS1_9PSEU|nr:nitroreductase family protein [Saccharopolyspora shandongensis]SDZ00267.1 Nitroreductase family protein [Saccharopolyspora shandongensis]
MNTPIGAVGCLTADQVRDVLLKATSAPSLYNSQPWRFHCTDDTIALHADRSRAVPVADPEHRELVLACGAALLNLRLAVRAAGVQPDVNVLPHRCTPDLLAMVRPARRRPATPTDVELAAAIPRRRTNRKPFLPTAVPGSLHSQLRQAAEAERAWLAIPEREQLPKLQALAQQAHDAQLSDAEFTAELRFWTGRNSGSPDGVLVSSSGPLPEPQDEWVLRDYSRGQANTRVAGKDFEPEPLICVLGSFQDGVSAQLHAGMAMQRVLLAATAAGLSSSFISQIVEVPTTRKELRELIGGGLWPQAVLRIGYGSPVPATPRRSLDDVVARN